MQAQTLEIANEKADASEKVPSLELASTVEQVEAYLEYVMITARNDVRSEKDYPVFVTKLGNAFLESGTKILEFAKDDVQREKGYTMKISGLVGLIEAEKMAAQDPTIIPKNKAKLDELFAELEKDEQLKRIAYNAQYQLFEGETRNLPPVTSETIQPLKEKIKKWVNTRPADFPPAHPIMFLLGLVETSELSNNPRYVGELLREMIAFVKSDQCTLDAKLKEETAESLEGYCRRCVGSFLELYGKTIDNTDFDWKAYRGKYVLVNFTASWCIPCRRELPGMKEAYKQYQEQGFEIVSVYISDSQENAKRMTEDEKITWAVLSEELTEQANQKPQGQAYRIQSVPTMLLIDHEGKVLATNLQGQALKNKLAEIFAPKE